MCRENGYQQTLIKGVVIIVILDMNNRWIRALVWSYKSNDMLMNFFINESNCVIYIEFGVL